MSEHTPPTAAEVERFEEGLRLRGSDSGFDPRMAARMAAEVKRLRRLIAAAAAATLDAITTCPGCGTDVSAPGAAHDAGCPIAALEQEACRP